MKVSGCMTPLLDFESEGSSHHGMVRLGRKKKDFTSLAHLGDGIACCDTGGDVSCVTKRGLQLECVKILNTRSIDVQLSFIDGSSTRAHKEHLLELTDDYGILEKTGL